ncbi:NADase-type glycan-binding domain-containing protein [Planosporangium sp. 12N6]|uniref:NADase-type glycan-binding domain-containing protein n=1 Tax=Planosporangium spinosum TaxID=3402278 RepID=UPI003CF00B1E
MSTRPVSAPAASPVPADRTGGAPADPDAGPADQPRAVQPGRPVARRPTVRGYTDQPDPGADGVRCPACGTATMPGRSFCRRCGAALAATTAAPAPPWWRRFRLPRRRRRWGPLGRLLTWLLVLALVAGLGYAAVVVGRRATDAVRDRLAKPEPVHPVSTRASSEAPGHPATSAVDGLSNRYWAPAATGPATGENVEFTFAAPIRLLDLIVHAGAAPEQEVFLSQARPARLELTVWTSGGQQAHTTLQLADRPGAQQFRWAVSDVVGVRLTIAAAYGDAPGRRVAVGEVEFFKRP